MAFPVPAGRRIVVFDLETTGFSPASGDRVIEIGAVAIHKKRIVEEFESLVRIRGKIPWQASLKNGITDEMLKGQPAARDVIPKFRKFIGQDALFAHNASFDMRFLNHEFGLLNLSLPNDYYCTQKLSKIIFPDLASYKLESVGRHVLGNAFNRNGLHRALADARVAAGIVMRMMG